MSDHYCPACGMNENHCHCSLTEVNAAYARRVDEALAEGDRVAGLQTRLAECERNLVQTKQAAPRGMDAAKAVSSGQLAEAARLRAESSPEALESEREANAVLTRENDELRAEVARLKDALEKLSEELGDVEGERDKAEAELAALREAIFEAPHGIQCAVVGGYDYPCNCWKRDALGPRPTDSAASP